MDRELPFAPLPWRVHHEPYGDRVDVLDANGHCLIRYRSPSNRELEIAKFIVRSANGTLELTGHSPEVLT